MEQARERHLESVKCFTPSLTKLCVHSLSSESLKGRATPVPWLFEILGYFSGFGEIRFFCRTVSFITSVRGLRNEWWRWANPGPSGALGTRSTGATPHLPSASVPASGMSHPWGVMASLLQVVFARPSLVPKAVSGQRCVQWKGKKMVLLGKFGGIPGRPWKLLEVVYDHGRRRRKLDFPLTVLM